MYNINSHKNNSAANNFSKPIGLMTFFSERDLCRRFLVERSGKNVAHHGCPWLDDKENFALLSL